MFPIAVFGVGPDSGGLKIPSNPLVSEGFRCIGKMTILKGQVYKRLQGVLRGAGRLNTKLLQAFT